MATSKPKPVVRSTKKPRLRTVPKIKIPRNLLKRGQLRCIYYPNRTYKRVFTPKKVGDIVCAMLASSALERFGSGFSRETGSDTSAFVRRQELRQQLDRCFPCEDSQQLRSPTQAIAVGAQLAFDLVAENARVIAVALSVLAALLFVPRLIPLLPRVALTLVPVAARATVTQLPALVTRLRAQQAANDAFFRAVSGLR